MGALRKPDPEFAVNRPDVPLSVGVLVDLELTENAGGHVKCWQRIAEASLYLPDRVDLTVYFLGDREQTKMMLG